MRSKVMAQGDRRRLRMAEAWLASWRANNCAGGGGQMGQLE